MLKERRMFCYENKADGEFSNVREPCKTTLISTKFSLDNWWSDWYDCVTISCHFVAVKYLA